MEKLINDQKTFLKMLRVARRKNNRKWSINLGMIRAKCDWNTTCCPITFIQNPNNPSISTSVWDTEIFSNILMNKIISAADREKTIYRYLRQQMIKILGVK